MSWCGMSCSNKTSLWIKNKDATFIMAGTASLISKAYGAIFRKLFIFVFQKSNLSKHLHWWQNDYLPMEPNIPNQYCFLKDTCFKCNYIQRSLPKMVQAPKLDDNLGDCCDIDNKIFNNFNLSKKSQCSLYTLPIHS